MYNFDQIDIRIENAKNGISIWKTLVKEYEIDTKTGVFQVTNQKEYDIVRENIFQIKMEKNFDRILIICSNSLKLKEIREGELITISLNDDELTSLIQLYCLFRFSSNYYLATIEYLNSSNEMGFLNKKNMEYEEVYKILALGLME